MTDRTARPPLDWSGSAPFPFTRESSIRVDAEGAFWHDGQRIEHAGLARALASWVSRHPVDGRWVLENGLDWCYLRVDDVPLFVRSVRVDGDRLFGGLSDGREEELDALTVDAAGAVRCTVRPTAPGGPIPARLSRHAQLSLAERFEELDGHVVLRVGARVIRLA